MQLKSLSDRKLWAQTEELAKAEQRTTLQLLEHLHEIEERRLYLKRGYASLFEYVHRFLGYSEPQAYERISAMRLMNRAEEAKEALEKGTMNLTQAAMTERFIRAEEREKKASLPQIQVAEVLKKVENRSKRETEKVLLAFRPKPVCPERIKQVSPKQAEVRFPISESTRQAMERFFELKGHCSMEEVFSVCLQFYLDRKDPLRKKSGLKGKVTEQKDAPCPSENKKQMISAALPHAYLVTSA